MKLRLYVHCTNTVDALTAPNSMARITQYTYNSIPFLASATAICRFNTDVLTSESARATHHGPRTPHMHAPQHTPRHAPRTHHDRTTHAPRTTRHRAPTVPPPLPPARPAGRCRRASRLDERLHLGARLNVHAGVVILFGLVNWLAVTRDESHRVLPRAAIIWGELAPPVVRAEPGRR